MKKITLAAFSVATVSAVSLQSQAQAEANAEFMGWVKRIVNAVGEGVEDTKDDFVGIYDDMIDLNADFSVSDIWLAQTGSQAQAEANAEFMGWIKRIVNATGEAVEDTSNDFVGVFDDLIDLNADFQVTDLLGLAQTESQAGNWFKKLKEAVD